MTVVNVQEAKTHLSRLLDRVAGGEEIVIAKAGRPVARLVAVKKRPCRRVPGKYEGKIIISDDFDAPLPEEIQDAFEGKGE